MATIRDVAKAAGVSVATVSRVINNNGYVHEDTRKAVNDAINLLHYKPNEVARSLFKKKSKLIGLILPDIANPFFPALARGIEDYFYQEGYHLIIGNSDDKQEKKNDYLDTFLQNNVVGLILSTNEIDFKKIQRSKIPIVLLDRIVEEFPAVFADQTQGGRLQAEKILERGCKKVTIIRGPVTVKTVQERFQAALEILEQENIKINIIDSKLSFQDGERTAVELFKRFPDSDAVLACNDTVAIAVLNEALRQGRCVPDDIQIIGFDDIYISGIVYPGLSTIHQPAYEMGMKAAQILIGQINQEPLSQLHYKFPVQFIERNSTRKDVD
ncbi:LacI family DNA-binding transcriptional regulator [Niallia sp. Krafla_26]|uniref:LacI family DNA-binding transcriptional regulator n=1 Tax=Niallia sp. Krafla_26 TaxID=3064703 RepID=UPI003D16381F